MYINDSITYITNLPLEAFLGVCNNKYIEYNDIYNKFDEICAAKNIVMWLNIDMFYNEFYFEENKYDDFVQLVIELYKYILSINNTANVIYITFECCNNAYDIILNDVHYARKIDFANQRIIDELRYFDEYLDIRHLICCSGINNVYDNKNLVRWGMPYTKSFLNIMESKINKIIKSKSVVYPKCIILDCDNVLWGGELTEDGISNIKLDNQGIGRLYVKFQQLMLQLKKRGVILAICSKNDINDVLKVINNHPYMELRESDFACIYANWNEKYKNIEYISDSLNISIDEIIFIDDSQYEIDIVNKLLTGIKPILFDLKTIFSDLQTIIFSSGINSNAELRLKNYKHVVERKEIIANLKKGEDSFVKLETQMKILESDETAISRISELSNRTNRCTNGIRLTPAILQECYQNSQYILLNVCVSDKFGDLGIVGSIIILNDNLCFFALSCRVMNRGIEKRMIEYIKNKYNIKSFWFKETGKNMEMFKMLKKDFIFIDNKDKI